MAERSSSAGEHSFGLRSAVKNAAAMHSLRNALMTRDLDLRMRRLRTKVGEVRENVGRYSLVRAPSRRSCRRPTVFAEGNHSAFHRLSWTAGPLSRPPASERDEKARPAPAVFGRSCYGAIQGSHFCR